ncbi:circularly permuted type 2 ATP-grasp protein [Sphingomonas sp. BGYR3]|uniref:circularly permuted type 2 ATP-grasp protein n=1 Tax=Sphingomonas sp. BGYR3 TaxID=2975483 RepID=UPI0021A27B3A|nr:circularly permuted type 2 ATP-grasp protein [Sphingomonas sp. BGYR3]MDG5488167.1 circularly permuted type 2 ATP-grasp protein [Sphingomonas sp. BGYR3]
MASLATGSTGTADAAEQWIRDYCGDGNAGDMLCAADGAERDAWLAMLDELAGASGGRLDEVRERAQRQADDIGTGYRIPGESEERPWPLSPVPLMIGSAEWAEISAGVTQRATLMEALIADIYGPGDLVSQGALPAALVTGSALFLRPMVGLTPPGGRHLHFYAVDLGRGPDGQWRVLADHVRAPTGAGYALENRLAIGRVLDGLQLRLNIQRHAPFFTAMRDGLAASCRRAEPRIGLLTPGRYNASYAEQAHLARYLGFLLVEGADLAVRDDKVYVRTVAGLKRIDALWRRLDPRLLDPLAFDSHSEIGVAGLVDAMAAGDVVVANAPGVGVVEAPALAAFLPALAERLVGAPLRLPNVATWWCGQPAERDHVLAHLDRMELSPAFSDPPLGLPGGQALLGCELDAAGRASVEADMARRPQDYVGREVVRLCTMPVVQGDRMVARPFTLRVFAARGPDGEWAVLPGGFARIADHPDPRAAVMGEGVWSADVCIHGPDPVDPVSLLPASTTVQLRRNPGTLPSRVADNMFWLGRYLERGEALLAVIRVLLGHSITADTGAALSSGTVQHLINLIVATGAASEPAGRGRSELAAFAMAALGNDSPFSVAGINRAIAGIGAISRDRLSADMTRLIDAPFPDRGSVLDRAGTLQRRYAAIAGLSAEHMARTDAWRFLDLGRRIERGAGMIQNVRAFMAMHATADDLSTLLDLADSQISYRQRYLTGIARVPVIDLVLLDPGNPRSLAYQAQVIREHLTRLPMLADDGIQEPQQALAAELAALVDLTRAASIEEVQLNRLNAMLADLSDAIARRYFLHGSEALRAPGLTLA